ncbi:cation:proton antiporter, partial [Bordetella hinzii]|nr:cation:proton antiporter [Bordetella hinzii]
MGLITLLLLAAVICVPLTQRLGLGAIPGYLAAGIAVGPSGLALVTDVPAMMSVSEWGVVMMLFVIGLELAPRRLWEMRAEVFGAGLRHLAGMSVTVAVLCGLSLALSSTAVALRLLEERGVLRAPLGRMALGILLFQDMAAIPMLVAAGMLGSGDAEPPHFGVALVAVLVVLAGYRLRFLTWIRRSELRELFTAATLLIVLGAAQLFDAAGLSAGLGGFLMGVLLAESRDSGAMGGPLGALKGGVVGVVFLGGGVGVKMDAGYHYLDFGGR